MLDTLGRSLYHYTTAAKAIDHILPTARLMLSPFSTMRDPRESSDWLMGASMDVPEKDEGHELFVQLFRSLNDAKVMFKVLSLTRDDTEGEILDELPELLRCGYGHPRLWEFYAESHTGVCLRLNREALLRNGASELGAKGQFDHRAVAYRNDRGIDRSLLHVNMSRVRELGVPRFVSEHLWQHRGAFFFRKLGDWATEMEYRLLLQVDYPEPEFLSIQGVLEIVICGYAIADDDIARVRELCEPSGITVQRLQWPHAPPTLFPVDRPAYHIDASFPAGKRL